MATSKKYYAKFHCGHSAYIRFFSRTELIKKLSQIEQGEVCPECKRKEFIKTAVRIEMSYGEYKEKYQNKRGIVTGEYNKENHKITVYMTPKLAVQYKEQHNKVYYDAENMGVDENGNRLIAIFLKGNSYRIKEELKQLGYEFKNRRWQKIITVFPHTYDEVGHKQLLPQDNPEFYSVIKDLEKIDCVNNIVSLNFALASNSKH